MPRTPGYSARPIAIPGVVEVQLVWTLPNGKTAHNVLHAEKVGDGSIDTALCSAIQDAVVSDARWTAYHPYLDAGTVYSSTTVRNLAVVNSPQFESLSDPAVGTGALGALPEGVAFCVTLKTAIAGKSGRGRAYLGGFDRVAADTDGRALPAFRTAATAFVQAVSDHLATLGYLLCVSTYGHDEYVSPITGRTIAAVPPGDHRVVSINALDSVFDSQRRRK